MGIFLRKNSPEALSAFLRTVEGEGVVFHPTDTVYGLGACAFSRRALRRVFLLKGRRQENPLLILTTPGRLLEVASHIPNSLRRIWDEFLAEPITAILPARHPRPYITARGKIGVRIPAEPFLLEALSILKCPLASTSANPSGRVLSLPRALEYFQDKVDLVLLGEDPGTLPSTVIDFTQNPPRLVRRGAYLPKSFPLKR